MTHRGIPCWQLPPVTPATPEKPKRTPIPSSPAGYLFPEDVQKQPPNIKVAHRAAKRASTSLPYFDTAIIRDLRPEFNAADPNLV